MDYIYVIDDENKKEKMEVVSIFNFEDSNYNYIIYKSLLKEEYFIGKYQGDNITLLDTNLNEKELNFANNILNTLIGEKDANK